MTCHQPFVQNPAGLQGSDPSEQSLVQPTNTQIRPRDDVFHESHYTWCHTPPHHGHPGVCPSWEGEPQAVMTHPWEHGNCPAMVHPWEQDHYPSMILPFMYHPWDPHMDACLHPYPSPEWECYLADDHHDWFHPWDHPHAYSDHPWDNCHW